MMCQQKSNLTGVLEQMVRWLWNELKLFSISFQVLRPCPRCPPEQGLNPESVCRLHPQT
jgi:hypothetical protein